MLQWEYMSPIGDGFFKSITHPHFLKALAGLVLIIGITWLAYHVWIRP